MSDNVFIIKITGTFSTRNRTIVMKLNLDIATYSIYVVILVFDFYSFTLHATNHMRTHVFTPAYYILALLILKYITLYIGLCMFVYIFYLIFFYNKTCLEIRIQPSLLMTLISVNICDRIHFMRCKTPLFNLHSHYLSGQKRKR